MCSTVDQWETKLVTVADILPREKNMEKWKVCGWAFLLGIRDGTGVSTRVRVRMVVPVRNGKHRYRCKRRIDHKLEARARVRHHRMTLVVLVSPVRPLSPLLKALHRPSLPPVHPPTRYHPCHLHHHSHQDWDQRQDKRSFRMKNSNNSWLALTLLLSAYLDYPDYPGCHTCQGSLEGRKLVPPLSLPEELELPRSELELVYPILLLLSPDPRSIYKLITLINVFHLLDLHFHRPQAVTVPHLMDIYRHHHLKGRQ